MKLWCRDARLARNYEKLNLQTEWNELTTVKPEYVVKLAKKSATEQGK